MDDITAGEAKQLEAIAKLLSLVDRLCMLNAQTIKELAEDQAKHHREMMAVTGEIPGVTDLSQRICKILAILAYTVEELQAINPSKEELKDNIDAILNVLPGGDKLKSKINDLMKEIEK